MHRRAAGEGAALAAGGALAVVYRAWRAAERRGAPQSAAACRCAPPSLPLAMDGRLKTRLYSETSSRRSRGWNTRRAPHTPCHASRAKAFVICPGAFGPGSAFSPPVANRGSAWRDSAWAAAMACCLSTAICMRSFAVISPRRPQPQPTHWQPHSSRYVGGRVLCRVERCFALR